MITPLDEAVTLIKVSAIADGNCRDCVTECLDEAVRLRPGLPWLIAAEGLAADDPDTYDFAVQRLAAFGDPQ